MDKDLDLTGEKSRKIKQVLNESLGHSIKIINIARDNILNSLMVISATQDRDAELPDDYLAGVIANVWIVIDTIHRLRKLLGYDPELKKLPAINKFLDRMPSVKSIRDFVHHIDDNNNGRLEVTRIELLAEKELPVWGVLSWISSLPNKPIRIHALISGTFTNAPLDNPAGKYLEGQISNIIFKAFDHEFDFSSAMKSFDDLVASKVIPTIGSTLYAQLDVEPNK